LEVGFDNPSASSNLTTEAARAQPDRPEQAPSVASHRPTLPVEPLLPVDRPLRLEPPLPVETLAMPTGQGGGRRGTTAGDRDEPPVVRVTIGRIEVRASPPEPPRSQPIATPEPASPRLSLDDYLERRKAGWG
jgi:hypothetical protein